MSLGKFKFKFIAFKIIYNTNMASSRPTRTVIPSSRLGADNVGEMQLTAHWQAISKAKGSKNPPTLTPTLLEPTSDGQGYVTLSRVMGTGYHGTGMGEKKITRNVPVPVLAGDGSVTRSVQTVDRPPP